MGQLMSAKGRRRSRFRRPLGERRYKKRFIIAIEGAKTEQQYFNIFNTLQYYRQSMVRVKCLEGSHDSSPSKVLKRMKSYLKQEELGSSDEAWLVVDKDQWPDEKLAELHAWSQGRDNYGFALSNPKFEYWLLLHFENGTGVKSSRQCSERLKRHISDYDKSVGTHSVTPEMIDNAVRRAKARDAPPCADWPRTLGSTTVYRLIEKIIQAHSGA